MRTGWLLVMVIFCAGAVSAQTEREIKKRIVGTWKLILTEETLEDGSKRPYPQYGGKGEGFLMYTADGYMCANLLNPEQVKWADAKNPTPEETLAKGQGSSAYCGRYEVDAKNRQLVHFPEVSTVPGYKGTRQVRPFAFEGNRMILRPPVDASTTTRPTDRPRVVSWKLVWEKVK